jgi:hypothetical protein
MEPWTGLIAALFGGLVGATYTVLRTRGIRLGRRVAADPTDESLAIRVHEPLTVVTL